ncbi:MAG: hypothetical protein IH600_03465 [Bacteroidetes bacterium]|nr:hypothetical protein [Bacteroidota bacterium]
MNKPCRYTPPFIVFLGLLLAASACTDNPFESDPTVAASKRRIRGTVRLSDRADYSGAYIWMEGFDLGTVTKPDGSFSLTLPPVGMQSTPGGNEGAFRLYAFLGNYRMQNVRTAVHDGTFVFPSTDVDEDGNIHEDLFLQELFSITTNLSRGSIEADSPRVLSIEVILRSSVPPVEVYYPRMVGAIEGPLLLHNLGTGEVEIFKSTVTGVEISDYVEIGPVAYSRSMILNIPKYKLQAGEYEIIPYLLPRDRNMPYGLLASLGTDISAMSTQYVYYPFLRQGGRLRVEAN